MAVAGTVAGKPFITIERRNCNIMLVFATVSAIVSMGKRMFSNNILINGKKMKGKVIWRL